MAVDTAVLAVDLSTGVTQFLEAGSCEVAAEVPAKPQLPQEDRVHGKHGVCAFGRETTCAV